MSEGATVSGPRFPLEQIEVPIPCAVPWETMTGDDRVRVCGECKKAVYQLKNYTRDEAERLLGALGGDACVQVYRRPDGTVVTSDCAPRPPATGVVYASYAVAAAALTVLWGWVMGAPNANSTFSFVGGVIRPTSVGAPFSTPGPVPSVHPPRAE